MQRPRKSMKQRDLNNHGHKHRKLFWNISILKSFFKGLSLDRVSHGPHWHWACCFTEDDWMLICCYLTCWDYRHMPPPSQAPDHLGFLFCFGFSCYLFLHFLGSLVVHMSMYACLMKLVVFCHVGPGDYTQAARLDSRSLHLLSHLPSSPAPVFLFFLFFLKAQFYGL